MIYNPPSWNDHSLSGTRQWICIRKKSTCWNNYVDSKCTDFSTKSYHVVLSNIAWSVRDRHSGQHNLIRMFHIILITENRTIKLKMQVVVQRVETSNGWENDCLFSSFGFFLQIINRFIAISISGELQCILIWW